MNRSRAMVFGAVAAIVVLIAAWFVLVLRPKNEDISDTKEQLEQAQQQEQSLRATLERLRAIDEDRPAIEAELRRLTAAIPPQPELASFILAAHDIANRAEIEFLSITPNPPTAQDGLEASVIAMSIRAEGRFFNVLDYLDRLEDLDRIVVVDSMNLTASFEQPEQPGTEAAVGGRTESPDEGPTAEPSPSPSPTPSASSPPSTSDPSEVRTFPSESGQVTTDVGSAEGQAARGGSGGSGSFVFAQISDFFLEPNIAIDLQARAFTTAPPASGEAPDGAPTATTTTVAGATPPEETTTTVAAETTPAPGGG